MDQDIGSNDYPHPGIEQRPVRLGEIHEGGLTPQETPSGRCVIRGSRCGDGVDDSIELQSPFGSCAGSSDLSFLTPIRNSNSSNVDDNLFGISPQSCSTTLICGSSIQSSNVTPVRRNGNNMTISEGDGIFFTPEHVKSGGTLYAATTNEEIIPPPTVGLIFGSWQEVEEYYKGYAKQQGFGVCRPQGTQNKNKILTGATWRCECYGSPYMRQTREAKKRVKNMQLGGTLVPEPPPRMNRKSKKCHCLAMLRASVNGVGEWEVKRVVLEHVNHQPTPSKWRGVKEYRMGHVTQHFKQGLITSYDSGAPVSQVRANLAERLGGIENVVLSEKDMNHIVQTDRKLKMEGGDANAMMAYFEGLQKDNDKFYHAHRLDQGGHLKDIMWVDARSRVAFSDFGEVVCFDATYLTNSYELPFANFVGVNHHGHSLLLGCALMSREDCDSFSWLFKQWRICMGGRCPAAILTDQAPAMRRPLQEVIPEARHRWCLWHIMNKIPTKLGTHSRYAELKDVVKEVVYECLCVEEFESRWSSMLLEYDVKDHAKSNDWLGDMYEERKMWVPAYMNNYFWAGMKTTQRVESINSFFDGFLERSTKLFEFPKKYCAAMNKRCSDEKDADANGMKYIRKLVTGFPIEKVFQKIYTDNKFRDLQRECERLLYCEVKVEKKISETEFEYNLEDRVWIIVKGKSEEVLTKYRKLYGVKFRTDPIEVSCVCKMFETKGILCRHCIRVLYTNNVDDVPERYILRRWRKDVYRKHMHVTVASYDPTKSEVVKRFDKMLLQCEPICEEATINDQTMQFVLNELQTLQLAVTERVNVVKQNQKFLPLESLPFQDQVDTTEGNIKNPLSRSKKKRGRPIISRHKALGENNCWKTKKKGTNKVNADPNGTDVEGPLEGVSSVDGTNPGISLVEQSLNEDIRSISAFPDDDILLSRNSIVWCDDVVLEGQFGITRE
ncbi:protein FAR1-RELATED SEQUENCE 8-like [Spinacia oleracea]|uniref:Protein FAR1-RELATED SEQUENCE 8-like n=1 Tax=Spinacia oleracea TaxID=3562 RepID=A0ABM3R428_SPIOL|nr:protein FAR1-RELATED SEQUENCE 8-like [Spinacia oleracea]